MNYRTLGKSGLRVSSLCMGTMTFGIQADAAEAQRLTDIALDRGINFFDTADSYTHGESERLLGQALRGRRDRVVIATKAGIPTGAGPNEGGLSRGYLLREVEQSLRNLQTDYIDLFFLHTPDTSTAIEESLETLTALIRSGRVRYAGLSNYAAWQMCEALWKSETHQLIPPCCVQMVYNLITRGIEQEVIPFTQTQNLGLITYNPLAGGFLTGKYSRSGPPENTRFSLFGNYPKRYWNDESFHAVEKLSAIAAEHDMTLAEMSLRWASTRPAVTSMLCGASRAAQLEENLKLLERGEPDAAAITVCDEFWLELTGHRVRYNR